jgi:hypothetical protein
MKKQRRNCGELPFMRAKPCVCEGSNENCMHCNGQGFVLSKARTPILVAHEESEPTERVKGNKKRLVNLEKLARMVNPLEAKSEAVKRGHFNIATRSHNSNAPNRASKPLIPPPASRTIDHIAGIIAIGATLKHSTSQYRNREVCRFCFRPVKFDGGTEKHLLNALRLAVYQSDQI